MQPQGHVQVSLAGSIKKFILVNPFENAKVYKKLKLSLQQTLRKTSAWSNSVYMTTC